MDIMDYNTIYMAITDHNVKKSMKCPKIAVKLQNQGLELTNKMIVHYWTELHDFNSFYLNYLLEDSFYRHKLEELSKKETFEPYLDGRTKIVTDNKTCFKNCFMVLFASQ